MTSLSTLVANPPAPTPAPPVNTLQQALRARRESIYSVGTIPFEDGTQRQVATAGVLPDRGEALRQLVRAESARTCVETGFAFGMSGSYILDALLDHPSNTSPTSPILTSMDPYQLAGFGGAGLRHFREVGASPLHEFHQLKSEVVLPRLIAEKRMFDVAFIDGDHRFEGVFIDVFFVRKLVGPGKLIIVDDLWMPAIKKCVAFLVSSELCELETRPDIAGSEKFALLRVIAQGEKRAWDHFEAF